MKQARSPWQAATAISVRSSPRSNRSDVLGQAATKTRLAAKALRFYPRYWTGGLFVRAAVRKRYKRFVVVGSPRVGSNLLRSLLNGHSAVLALGEVFREGERVGWDMPFFPSGKRLALLRDHQPGSFLDEKVFGPYPPNIRAVGFKLFYRHAQEGKKRQIWDWLAADTQLVVIHLKRRNLLRSYLSRALARNSGQWVQHRPGQEIIQPLRLDVEECRRFFQNIERQQQETDRLFASHSSIVLHYEDLAADHVTAMRPVFSRLGIEPERVQPMIYKQASLPLHQAIENFHELKANFDQSRWRTFFE